MRLLAFDVDGQPRLGVRRGQDVVDLTIAAPDLPRDPVALLEGGPDALARARQAAENPPVKAARPADGIVYHPPIWNPRKIICVGLNYRDHAAEGNFPIPEFPVYFLRLISTLVAHQQPLVRPKLSEKFDYEAELVAVIGKGGRHIPEDRALEHVAGYSCFNEGSLRDYQMRGPQWTLGKNFDGTGAFGPDFVTADELPAGAKGLGIRSRINGQTLQDSNTSDMIFDVARLVSEASGVMTLQPGDVFVTGTPAGVGFARKPRVWMKAGDTVDIEIDGIGTLTNPVIDEA
ncbi:MAG: fumarylacetoacetate hydrolase family protein [Alphaproteobacteria bacterium]